MTLFFDSKGLAGAQGAAVDDLGEHAFLGHYAVAQGLKDVALAVALFADLGDLQFDLVRNQSGADREIDEVQPLGGDVLGKGAGLQIETLGDHLPDAFHVQQADLPVPVGGVGIAHHAMGWPYFGLDNRFLARALGGADIERDNDAHTTSQFQLVG